MNEVQKNEVLNDFLELAIESKTAGREISVSFWFIFVPFIAKNINTEREARSVPRLSSWLLVREHLLAASKQM